MPVRRRLTADERGRALALLDEGFGVREVSRRFQVSHSTIQRLRDRFNATGSSQERPHTGRPRVTTRQQDRQLILGALRDRTSTSMTLRGHLRTATGVNISRRTVGRRLHEAGLRSRRPAVRPILSAINRRRRLAWARQHVTWTRQQWGRVLFSDESRFTLSFNDGRLRVWRRQGERYADATVQEHNRYGGGSVMVWGGMSLGTRTPLLHIDGNLNGVRYRDEVLRPAVLPALANLGQGAIFQDDNAPAHRARLVTNFLGQHQVIRMVWPACSPDLNPIEHLWDVLGRRIRLNHPPPATRARLVQILQMEWNAIPQATLRTLVNSVRRRCEACIQARGGHTRY